MADRLSLVVEGPDDKHVIWAILEAHNFEPQFKIVDEGGYEILSRRLAPRLKPGSDLERFGIVVDADLDLVARWQSVKNTLERAGYIGLPNLPDSSGTIIDHEFLPRVGVRIMPNNELPDMLEDFLSFLVPAGDALLERARQSLDGIPAEQRRFAEVHRPKALIHTWLAWQEDAGTPMGQAVTRRYFNPGASNVSAFRAWLTRLFA